MLLIIAHLFHFEFYHYTAISQVTSDIESQKEHFSKKACIYAEKHVL